MKSVCSVVKYFRGFIDAYRNSQPAPVSFPFFASSQVVAPNSALLYRASGRKEEIRVMEIDIKLARNKWIAPRNHIINDRRGEFYEV